MSSESNYSFTTKIHGDLFTVRGDTAEEFQANVELIITNKVLDSISSLQEMIASDGSTGSVKNVQNAFAATPTQPPTPQTTPSQATEAPQESVSTFNGLSSTPSCDHGPRKWNEGISKAGNPYRGWFCQQTDRSQQCKPMFVNAK